MPNPYDPNELKRQSQISQLTGAPASNTMPVGGAMGAATGAAPDWRVSPRGTAPAGFDQKNWDDPGMQSVKYRAGRLLSGASKPSEVAARVNSPEFQQAFKGATFDGKDRVNFQGALSDGESGVPVYDIDVLMGADRDSDSSNGLWWGHDVAGMNQGPSDAAAAAPMMTPQAGMSPAGDNSALAKIMEELQAAQQGAQSPTERDAVMQMLMQGGI
jgi:hypothetical protein